MTQHDVVFVDCEVEEMEVAGRVCRTFPEASSSHIFCQDVHRVRRVKRDQTEKSVRTRGKRERKQKDPISSV